MTTREAVVAPTLSLPISETAASVPGRSHVPEKNSDGFIRTQA
jgi:hypothetical protein